MATYGGVPKYRVIAGDGRWAMGGKDRRPSGPSASALLPRILTSSCLQNSRPAVSYNLRTILFQSPVNVVPSRDGSPLTRVSA